MTDKQKPLIPTEEKKVVAEENMTTFSIFASKTIKRRHSACVLSKLRLMKEDPIGPPNTPITPKKTGK